jgi:hypothetical protein
METFFLPCAMRAKSLRSSMSSLLFTSLKAQFNNQSYLIKKITSDSPLLPKASYARPEDFAAYFDLLTLTAEENCLSYPLQIDSVRNDASKSLDHLSRLSPDFSVMPIGPKISTLNHEYYQPNHIESLIHWWDMEPNNSLQLTAVSEDSLASASAHIDMALHQLLLAAPEFYQELVVIVSDIVLANAGKDHKMEFGGISSFCAWGSICLNEALHQHWTDYYKKIVHECSHLVLFAIARNEPLVLNSISEKFSSPLREDLRPIDGIYHAAFVSAREALALEACIVYLENQDGVSRNGSEIAKLENLLHSSVLAFWDCLEELNHHAKLSSLGEKILKDTKQYMVDTFDVLNAPQ